MKSKDGGEDTAPPQQIATRLVTGGRDPFSNHGFVNPPVYHASTVLYPSAGEFLAHRARYQYGRRGTPTSEALEGALRELEGPECAGVCLVPSGLAAVSVALLSVLQAGDHVLVADNVYRPTRHFCDAILSRLGITVSYFDPLIGGGVAALMLPNTRAVYFESPGSLTFEMTDVPALAAAARGHDAVVLMDNTWASPVFFRPLEYGVDISVQAGTKYIGGHSDVMLGTISANARVWQKVREMVLVTGLCVGPDDMYLSLRGLRTLGVRLARHHESGLRIARWLAQRPEVEAVLHPGLESHPGHAIWRRDFSGASGLFSIVLAPVSQAAANAFVDALDLFGIGASWGGYESLAIPFDCAPYRTATTWAPAGPTVRFHIGLEDAGDLIADLERGFSVLAAAR